MASRGDRSRRNKPSKAGPSASTTPEIEAEVLQQLAELGLVVPVRDPNRPHTNTEGRCWKVGMAGLPAKGGGSFHGRFPCRSRGCDGCASLWANQEMAQFRQAQPDFVGLGPITTENLSYRPSTDKIDAGALWVASVLTPPESLKLLKDRIATRCRRLVVQGHRVEYVVVPCDGVAVIAATADFTEDKARGRPLTSPTAGWWLPTAVVHLFLHRVLSSTAVCGRIFWTKGWKPKEEKPRKRAYVIAAPPRITETAHRILLSEGYVFTPSAEPSWTGEDPIDVLLDAKRRAERFWEDPRCSGCDVLIGPDDDHWWRDSEARCGVCDLALALVRILTRGLTEREIEARLRRRKLTFKRRRGLIEEALVRAGAQKMPSGIWIPKSAEEGAA